MSSSPSICASPNFTFPPSNKSSNNDYFNVTEQQNFGHMASSGQADYLDHSKAKHTSTGSIAHKNFNDSISSLTSNTSDLTIYDNSTILTKKGFRTYSMVSTDTLVDENPMSSKKNFLNLKLNVAKHRHNQSLNASKDFKSYSFNEEDEYPKANSSIESKFDFNHKEAFKGSDCVFNPESSPGEMSIKLTEMNYNPPSLKKYMTLSSLKLNHELSYESINREQLKRYHPIANVSYRESILKLSTQIKYVSIHEANDLIKKSGSIENPPNLLIIDIRPFTDYIRSHIKHALNVCLPSTLLKRSNFNLNRCINSLPLYEKSMFKNYLKFNEVNKMNNTTVNSEFPCGKFGLPSILLYDNCDSSSNLYHFCKKFLDKEIWDESSPIFLLDSGFNEFEMNYPNLVDSGTNDINPSNNDSDRYQPPLITNNEKIRSISLSELSVLKPMMDIDCDSTSTPILSNFKLPSTPRNVFKIRHNEEILTNHDETISTTIKLENDYKNDNLPTWIKLTLNQPNKLNDDFNLLENFEQKRLTNALSLNKSSNEDGCPSISSGIEFGHKNRYKDIFLFEHTRVKLKDSNKQQLCDYINASYLNPITNLNELTNKSMEIMHHLKYIATQGPLDETIGDFWKCIINHKTPIIVSLTNDIENGILKCSPYWKTGKYKSNLNLIQVNLIKQEVISEFLVIRSFNVSMDNLIYQKVLQIHLLSWPDMGSLSNFSDLISLVVLKNYIINHLTTIDCNYHTLVHCSAGCGRTGTLCTVDTIINILMINDSKDLKFDPAYSIVKNFREQRISMVQNLRQYYLIYDILLNYLNNHDIQKWDKLIKLDITGEFINSFS